MNFENDYNDDYYDDNCEIKFLTSKTNCFKWNKLVFEDEEPYIFHDMRLDLTNEKNFDLWGNEFDIAKSIHFNTHLQIHYEYEEKCLPFLLKIENINGVITRGTNLKRLLYFKPTSLVQTSMIYEIFAKFEDKIFEYLEIPHCELLDDGLIQFSAQRLPRNIVTYFKNLIVCFEKVEEVIHRKKKKYCLVSRIIHGDVLLPKD